MICRGIVAVLAGTNDFRIWLTPARRMALRQVLLTLCVVGSAADNMTTTTAAAGGGGTTTLASGGGTTMASTTAAASNTTGAPTTGTTTITGSLTFNTGSAAECAAMQTSNGTLAMNEVIKNASGVTDTSNIAVTVNCGTRRRLSDGRRLSGSKATVAYTLTIPVGSAANAAATAEANLKATTDAQFTTYVTQEMAAKSITVAVSGMAKTDPTSSTTSNVSFAASMFSVGAAGIFAWLILALR